MEIIIEVEGEKIGVSVTPKKIIFESDIDLTDSELMLSALKQYKREINGLIKEINRKKSV